MVVCLRSKTNLAEGGAMIVFIKTILIDSEEQKYSVSFVCSMLRKLKLDNIE